MHRVRTIAVAMITMGILFACQDKKGQESQSQVPKANRSLYDRLGGEPAIRAVVDDFVPRAASDPKVNFARKNVSGFTEWEATPQNVQRVKDGLVAFIGQATGGPQKYTGKDMKTGHRGMKITSAEFDAIATDLKASLDKLRVPATEQAELMAIVGTTRNDIVEVR